MNYDPERLVSRIHKANPGTDDQMTLGFKGLGLKQMAAYKHQVPQGFILTTELFSAMPAMAHRPLFDDTLERVRRAVGDLEKETGLRLGDPSRLLTLSIRSGAAISMPGLMTTFVDVGLNDKLAEALSRKPGFEWAAWDSYRRFLQTWAMASGIDRDVFDAIMVEFKARYGVERKSDFLPEHMRETGLRVQGTGPGSGGALHRRPLPSGDGLHPQGPRLLGFPRGQAVPAVPRGRGGVGHGRGGPADGVREPEPGVRVGRHLHPQPAGAAQQPGAAVRRLHRPQPGRGPGGRSRVPLAGVRGPAARQPDLSRARAFSGEGPSPESTRPCWTWPETWSSYREHDPQEIEFTFESDAAKDLYILQKRAMVQEQTKDSPYFDTSSRSFGPAAAVGMGVAGGAYSGRVAMNIAQIDKLASREARRPHRAAAAGHRARGHRHDHPGLGVADRPGRGHLSRGGHRQAPGQDRRGRLPRAGGGRTPGVARLAGHELKAGDWLSIDGRTGNIFLGRIPTTSRVLQQ